MRTLCGPGFTPLHGETDEAASKASASAGPFPELVLSAISPQALGPEDAERYSLHPRRYATSAGLLPPLYLILSKHVGVAFGYFYCFVEELIRAKKTHKAPEDLIHMLYVCVSFCTSF